MVSYNENELPVNPRAYGEQEILIFFQSILPVNPRAYGEQLVVSL